MVFGEEPALACLRHRRREEGARHLVLEQPLTVVAEGGGIEARVHDVQVQEPLEEEVVLEALAELALRADGVEGHQECALEQVLRRDRGPAALRIHRGKGR